MDSYTSRRSRSPTANRDFSRTDSWTRDGDSNRDAFRRRSPDRRRRRSRSPVSIDRYQPGKRDEHYSSAPSRRDDYRRRSPGPPQIDRYVPGERGNRESPAPVVSNPIPNPLTLDYQVGFSFFAEWWRKEKEVKEEKEYQKNGGRRPERPRTDREIREEREKLHPQIQAAYDEYKEKMQTQMARSFVNQHMKEEWFKERYDPDISIPFRQRLSEFRRTHYTKWQTDLDNGVFDDFSLEGIYKSDSDGAGGVVEKEEGEAAAAPEGLGVGDLVPAKGADLRDESALQPALLIKTIAPHVGRDKIEAFCKEHLGEGEGGFQWLSLSDPNLAKRCHRIGWVMLNPGGEEEDAEMTSADRGDGRDEAEDGEEKIDVDEPNGASKTPANRAMEKVNGKSIEDPEKGNFTCHVGVHAPQPQPKKKALWDLFSAPERIERDLQLAMRLVSRLEQELGEDVNATNKIEERVEDLRIRGQLQPIQPSQPVREEPEDGEDGEMEEDGMVEEDVDDEELLAKKKKLDLMVEYLRRVFHFCFYCVFEADSVHELCRKCPAGHLRRPRASLTNAAKEVARASAFGDEFPLGKKQEADGEEETNGETTNGDKPKFDKKSKTQVQLQQSYKWAKTFEDKLFQILEPDAIIFEKIGGKPVELALEDELKKWVKQEDESKFRCRLPDCTKLFKGETFWRKHVEKRHAEWFEELKKELDMVNRYVADPAHVAPARSDATSNGHFPQGNHAAMGTPRGFSLQNMNSGLSQAGGPMRRGGRFNNRQAGPYDRQQGNQGRGRFNSGRLSPPRGRNVSGGNMRFPDAQQPGAMAPREAVAGRSLKSYEDLDAADSKPKEDLDY